MSAHAGFTVTEDRKKNINFTDSYITTKQDIIVKDGTAAVLKNRDLIRKVI